MKRLAAVLSVILFSLSLAAAREGVVTWTWYENDPMVGFYRYQVDGEEPDMWTLVDRSVNEVSITLDVSVVHTLYLQQSYDGILWSASSSTDSEVFPEEEIAPEPVEEDLPPEEEVPEEIPVPEEPEEPVAVDPAAELFIPLSQLDLGLCYMNCIPDSPGSRAIGVNASYSRTFAESGVFGFGVRAGLSACVPQSLFSGPEGIQVPLRLDVAGLITARVDKCDIYMALGPGVCFAAGRGGYVSAGFTAALGVRYHRTESLSFGLVLTDSQYLSDREHICNIMDIGAYVSLSV